MNYILATGQEYENWDLASSPLPVGTPLGHIPITNLWILQNTPDGTRVMSVAYIIQQSIYATQGGEGGGPNSLPKILEGQIILLVI